jgi:hypothetical protein
MLTLPVGSLASISVSLLCVLSQKRILFPLMHSDCNHSIQSVAIFDLYTLMTRLEAKREEAIKCPMGSCQSQFTFDNYLSKGIFDEKLRDYAKREPLYNITLCFSVVGGSKSWLHDDE